MERRHTDALNQIGFNDEVLVGQRRLHVQTEVIAASGLKIRTTVIERGAVRHVENSSWDEPIDDLERTREMVGDRHRAVVARVENGDIG